MLATVAYGVSILGSGRCSVTRGSGGGEGLGELIGRGAGGRLVFRVSLASASSRGWGLEALEAWKGRLLARPGAGGRLAFSSIPPHPPVLRASVFVWGGGASAGWLITSSRLALALHLGRGSVRGGVDRLLCACPSPSLGLHVGFPISHYCPRRGTYCTPSLPMGLSLCPLRPTCTM